MTEYITEEELRIRLNDLLENFLSKLEENEIIEQIALLSEKIYHSFAIGYPIDSNHIGRTTTFNDFFTTSKEFIFRLYETYQVSQIKFTRATREFLNELEEK